MDYSDLPASTGGGGGGLTGGDGGGDDGGLRRDPTRRRFSTDGREFFVRDLKADRIKSEANRPRSAGRIITAAKKYKQKCQNCGDENIGPRKSETLCHK